MQTADSFTLAVEQDPLIEEQDNGGETVSGGTVQTTVDSDPGDDQTLDPIADSPGGGGSGGGREVEPDPEYSQNFDKHGNEPGSSAGGLVTAGFGSTGVILAIVAIAIIFNLAMKKG